MQVHLQRNKDKYLRRGYPWVFRNQIKRIDGEPKAGGVARIFAHDGAFLGQGLLQPDSQIVLRFVTSDPEAVLDADFFVQRLRHAIALRRRAFPDVTHERVVFGESDGLPGTIIDRYGGVLTWSCLSFGMERHREALLDALKELFQPTAIVERNDNPLRAKDGLEPSTGVLFGDVPSPVEIIENGVRYHIDVIAGPKTGFFIDQRLHREHIRRYAAGSSVLDAFSSDGGFGLQAAHAGARSVRLIDISPAATARARHNAALNGLESTVSIEQADALELLGSMAKGDERFDLIILDPPAFAKRRRDVDQAERAYQSININAFRLLADDGILATSSCSQAIDQDHFLKIIRYAARKTGVGLRLLYRGCQPPDHPVLDSMPETENLKFFIFQLTGDLVPSRAES
jgi:23S rRNA (cytosine1962-C5)-methyltransferase